MSWVTPTTRERSKVSQSRHLPQTRPRKTRRRRSSWSKRKRRWLRGLASRTTSSLGLLQTRALRSSLMKMRRRRCHPTKSQASSSIPSNRRRRDLSPDRSKRLTNRLHPLRRSTRHTNLSRGHSLGWARLVQKSSKWSTSTQIAALVVSLRLF
jgi:hypothetical protein